MSWMAAIPLIGKIIEKVIPDPDKATKVKN